MGPTKYLKIFDEFFISYFQFIYLSEKHKINFMFDFPKLDIFKMSIFEKLTKKFFQKIVKIRL